MSEYFLLKFGHLLLFVYWLGGDLGTFYSSKFVANAELSVEARGTAATIMMAVDQAPRICMTLILPFGLHLAYNMGIFDVNFSLIVAIWIISIGWFAMVVVQHVDHSSAFIPALIRLDFWFRLVMIVALTVIGSYALLFNSIFSADWAAIKLLVFAGLMVCGLLIRVQFKPFGPAFETLLREGPSDAVNQSISSSIARSKPFVYVIWLGLLFNAALGLHLLTF